MANGPEQELIAKIARNIQRLVDADKSNNEINSYLKTQGYDSPAQWRASYRAGVKISPDSPMLDGSSVSAVADETDPAGTEARAEAMAGIRAGTLDPDTALRDVLKKLADARHTSIPEAARLIAAGTVPGYSDNIIARARAMVGAGDYASNLTDEEQKLAEARLGTLSPLIEMGGMALGGLGAEAGLAQIPGRIGGAIRGVTGLGLGPARSLGQAVGRGARIGGTYGALTSSGDNHGGVVDHAVAAAGGYARGLIPGAVLGGAFHGLLPTPRADARDMARVFELPTGTKPNPLQNRTVGHLAQGVESQGINPAQERATLLGRVPPEARPTTVAQDFLGPDIQREIGNTVDAANVPARRSAIEPLETRAKGRGSRSGPAIEGATGRSVGTKDVLLERLEQERAAVNEVMYGRAKVAQAKRVADGGGTAITSDAVRAELQKPSTAKAAEKVRERMQASPEHGETWVDPYLRDDKGNIIYTVNAKTGQKLAQLRPFRQQDPATMYNISQELGTKAKRLTDRGKKTDASPLWKTKKVLEDEVVSVNPELVEANRVAHQLQERVRAAKEGLVARKNTPNDVRAQLKPYRDAGDIILPTGAQGAVNDALIAKGLRPAGSEPTGTFSGPAQAYVDGAQSTRVSNLGKADANPTRVPFNLGDQTDEILFGKKAASKLRAHEKLESLTAQTESVHPMVQGNLKGEVPSNKPGIIRSFGSVLRDLGNTAGSPGSARQTGYAAGNISGALASKAAQITQEGGAAMAQATLNPSASAQNSLFRGIQQINQGYNTPFRRGFTAIPGLLGGTAGTRQR